MNFHRSVTVSLFAGINPILGEIFGIMGSTHEKANSLLMDAAGYPGNFTD
jgi:hypothetical protein